MTPIYDISPFTALDYPGKLSAILWFAGCNLRCPYCYNPQIVRGRGAIGIETARAFLKSRLGLLDGVVLSGGEPTLHDDLADICRIIRKMGFAIKLDTNGMRPDRLSQLINAGLIDYIALDFKAPPERWHAVAGGGSFENFARSLTLLCNAKIPFEIRSTIHPDLLSADDVAAMRTFLRTAGYNGAYYLQPYRHTQTLGDTAAPPPDWRHAMPDDDVVWRS